MSDLARGFAYPLRGVALLFRSGPLMRLAIWPALLSAAGLAVAAGLSIAYGPDLLARLWPKPEAWHLVALWYLTLAGLVVTSFAAGMVILPPLVSAPFHEPLARQAEILTAGKDEGRERPLWSAALLAVADQGAKTLVLVVGYALIAVVWLLPVVGGPLFTVLMFLWTSLWCAADFLDVPMSRHRYRFRDLRGLLRGRTALALGFGAATSLLLMVPLLNFLFVPAAVVAATLLFLALRKEGALPG